MSAWLPSGRQPEAEARGLPGPGGTARQALPAEPRPGFVTALRSALPGGAGQEPAAPAPGGGWFSGQNRQERTIEPRPSFRMAFQSALPRGLSLVSSSSRSSTFLAVEGSQDFSSTLCPGLTLQQRAIGFAVCLAVGLLLDFFSFGKMAQAFRGHPERYAVMYTIGNITAMAGTFFLAGPMRQLKRMMTEGRWIASLAFVASMVLTLAVAGMRADFHGRALLIILLVLVQWCALVWYALSYIPFGREMVGRALSRFCCSFG